MSSQWVASSTALPQDGASVEFVLDGRKIPIDGNYTRQTFQSRWSGYDVQRVRAWRPVRMDSSAPAFAAGLNAVA